jgi:hypothetical protein
MGRTRFEGIHCTLSIARPAPAVVVLTLTGRDVGELGDAPFAELEKDVAGSKPLELFIDARAGQGASIDVSGSWAAWLRANKGNLSQVTMLTGSRFIQLSAEMVRNFAELGEAMRITSLPEAFEEELARAIARSR